MTNPAADNKTIEKISANLSEENKRYVIAVANALIFSQNSKKRKSLKQTTQAS